MDHRTATTRRDVPAARKHSPTIAGLAAVNRRPTLTDVSVPPPSNPPVAIREKPGSPGRYCLLNPEG